MFKKSLSVGLILLLLLGMGGCQTEGTEKNAVYSTKQKAANGIEKAAHSTVSIQQAEAVEKAEAAFKQYFNIQSIDKNLIQKAALIEDNGIRWKNPYWKLSWWVAKDSNNPVYSAQIDAQSGEVVQLRYRPHRDHKVITRQDVLSYQKTALAFMDKYDLVKEVPVNLFEAFSSYMEGIGVEFRYGPDQFIMLYFNEAGTVSGFEFSQQVAYTLQGNDLKIDRPEAIKMARASIKEYYGAVDTSGLIEQVRLFEGDKGEKNWFVSWKNIAPLEGRFIRYGAQIDALSGKVCAVEESNHSLDKEPIAGLENNEEKLREIAEQFLDQKNLSGYRFDSFVKDTGTLRYMDKAGSPLHVLVDRSEGKVSSLFFFELK